MDSLQPAPPSGPGRWGAAVSPPVEVEPGAEAPLAAGEVAACQRWGIAVAAFSGCSALALLGWAFHAPYVLQDDGRQHLFWMQRFTDPTLFPQDPSADYFQTLAPPGYTALYRLLARSGLAPLLAAKLLPPLLLLLTAWLTFQAGRAMLGSPAAAGIGALLYVQILATNDDLNSATPRAFVGPILAGFAWAGARRRGAGALLCIGLIGLFYPQLSLIMVGALVLLELSCWKGATTPPHRQLVVLALALVGAIALIYHDAGDQFGPLVARSQARVLPEFGPGGRAEFFVSNPLQFWLIGDRSGLIPLVYHSPLLWAGFGLAFLVKRYGERRPAELRVLAALIAASLLLYALAHLLLFKLHLPNRYVRHTLLFVLSLGAGYVLAAAWARLRSLPTGDRRRHFLPAVALGLFILPSLLVPLWNTGMMVGRAPALYRFFAETPRGTLVASLSEEGDNLPTFAGRSTLVSGQATLPYHRGYYHEMRKRLIDLVRAQYTADPGQLGAVVRRYEIDYLLLDRDAYTPDYLTRRSWLRTTLPPEVCGPVLPGSSYLEKALPGLTVLDTRDYRVVDVRWLREAEGASLTHSERASRGGPPGSGAVPEAPPAW